MTAPIRRRRVHVLQCDRSWKPVYVTTAAEIEVRLRGEFATPANKAACTRALRKGRPIFAYLDPFASDVHGEKVIRINHESAAAAEVEYQTLADDI